MRKFLISLVVSLAGLISILAQPAILQPPTNQVLAVGETLTLGVTAGGAGPLEYQWFKDGRRLLGATGSTLTVANAGVTNSGTYFIVVTNSTGMVISTPALVAVGHPYLSVWGPNAFGQLGNGTTNNVPGPTMVASDVVAGAAGYWHSLFVKADGTLWATGCNDYGQLGTGGSFAATNRPAFVASNVVAAAAGELHSLFGLCSTICG